MKKMLLKLALIGGLALSIFSCSNDADYSDIVKFTGANETAKSSKAAADDIDAASVSAVLYSNLNPGYGNAVYFAGTFKGQWAVAYRGNYSEADGWTYTVRTDNAFEWKALTGSYDLGVEVNCKFAGLRYLGSTSAGGSNPNPRWYSTTAYGEALYFVGHNVPTTAIRGTLEGDHWTTPMTNGSTQYDVYIGSWDLGETVNSYFDGLTWDNGDNNVYEYDGHDGDADGIVTRRAISFANIDNGAIAMGTINAMTNAFKEQKIDGKNFVAVEMYTDLTLKEITDTVQEFFKDTDDDDISYVFINAHGGSSGVIALPKDQYMNGASVRTLLDKYVRGEVVVLIESCHAGNIINRGLLEDTFADSFVSAFKAEESDSRVGELASTRYHVICSSSKTQLSWTWSNVIGFASQFWSNGMGWDGRKKYAVDLLADANYDSKVTMNELYNYSLDKVNDEINGAFTDGTTQTVVVYPTNDDLVIGGRF